jgi:hypothetical protein
VSSSYFAADPDGLAKTAPYVRTYSDLMRQVVTQLHSGLAELGDCWDDDSTGKAFEEQVPHPPRPDDGLKSAKRAV